MPGITMPEKVGKEKSVEVEKKIDELINRLEEKDPESAPAAMEAKKIKEEIKRKGDSFTMKEFEKILEKVVNLGTSGDILNSFFMNMSDAMEKTKEFGKINNQLLMQTNKALEKIKDEYDVIEISKALYSDEPLENLKNIKIE